MVDTSGWIALLSRDDRFHERALARYDELSHDHSCLSWRVLEQYRDVKLSLTDAACAVTAQAGRILDVLGCDDDFETLGFVVLPGPR